MAELPPPDALAAVDGAATAVGRNRLLRALPADELARLLPHLEPVSVAVLQPIAEVGAPIPHVYFPESAVISILSRLENDTLIENGTVGVEGMTGLRLVLGEEVSTDAIMGQVPGVARRLETATFLGLLPTLPTLEALLRRYTLYFMAQMAQSLACNSVHALEQRCARWLLMTHDRMEGDDFLLTHQVLAQMLAVRRAGVSVAADALRRQGLIAYRRGCVTVLDRTGLESVACECYGMVRRHRQRLLGH